MILMGVMVFTFFIKIFYYAKLFKPLTPITVMLRHVIWDLKVFLMFFTIIVIMLAQLFSILQVGRNGPIAKEYKYVGLWVGHIIWTLRATLGDFSIVANASTLDETEQIFFFLGLVPPWVSHFLLSV